MSISEKIQAFKEDRRRLEKLRRLNDTKKAEIYCDEFLDIFVSEEFGEEEREKFIDDLDALKKIVHLKVWRELRKIERDPEKRKMFFLKLLEEVEFQSANTKDWLKLFIEDGNFHIIEKAVNKFDFYITRVTVEIPDYISLEETFDDRKSTRKEVIKEALKNYYKRLYLSRIKNMYVKIDFAEVEKQSVSTDFRKLNTQLLEFLITLIEKEVQ